MKKILFFGFSVTEEKNGYISILQKNFNNDVHIEYKAIGGIALWAVPYLYEILEYEKYDYVVFEISTCLRYAEHAPHEYYQDLENLICRVFQKGARPSFVQLYRDNISYENDCLTAQVNKICEAYKIPNLNLYKEILDKKNAGILTVYLRDGTHTTDQGAYFYGNYICDFLRNVVLQYSYEIPPNNTLYDFCFLSVTSLLNVNQHSLKKFSRGCVELAYLEIPEGETMYFELPSGCELRGVLLNKGPRTGVFEVSIDNVGFFKILAFDRYCYYKRFSTWKSPLSNSSKFSITQTSLASSEEIIKGEKYFGNKVGEICGFLIEKNND